MPLLQPMVGALADLVGQRHSDFVTSNVYAASVLVARFSNDWGFKQKR
jgi:hypothetical protein